MLVNNLDHRELGPDQFTRHEPTHGMRRITKQANARGPTVRLDPIHQTAAAIENHSSSIFESVNAMG